jgi:hypothetical protein
MIASWGNLLPKDKRGGRGQDRDRRVSEGLAHADLHARLELRELI